MFEGWAFDVARDGPLSGIRRDGRQHSRTSASSNATRRVTARVRVRLDQLSPRHGCPGQCLECGDRGPGGHQVGRGMNRRVFPVSGWRVRALGSVASTSTSGCSRPASRSAFVRSDSSARIESVGSVVVRRNHLGLGHDRKRHEIRRLETFRLYAMQPRRVERRMVDRGAKQPAQRVALMRGDALRRPTEPVEVLRQRSRTSAARACVALSSVVIVPLAVRRLRRGSSKRWALL